MDTNTLSYLFTIRFTREDEQHATEHEVGYNVYGPGTTRENAETRLRAAFDHLTIVDVKLAVIMTEDGDVIEIVTPASAVAFAARYGREAFERGAMSVPAHDPAIRPLLKACRADFKLANEILKAWSDAWHAANIAEPVPGVDMPGRPAAPVAAVPNGRVVTISIDADNGLACARFVIYPPAVPNSWQVYKDNANGAPGFASRDLFDSFEQAIAHVTGQLAPLVTR